MGALISKKKKKKIAFTNNVIILSHYKTICNGICDGFKLLDATSDTYIRHDCFYFKSDLLLLVQFQSGLVIHW
jgi:hypothetical protein